MPYYHLRACLFHLVGAPLGAPHSLRTTGLDPYRYSMGYNAGFGMQRPIGDRKAVKEVNKALTTTYHPTNGI